MDSETTNHKSQITYHKSRFCVKNNCHTRISSSRDVTNNNAAVAINVTTSLPLFFHLPALLKV